MASMPDEDWIADVFSRFGPVRTKPMFGGGGFYADNLIFAIWANDTIWLKASPATVPDFEAEGEPQFSFTFANGRVGQMNYWRVPDRLLDDAEEMAVWARKALEVSRAARKPARKKG
jgi:DNA transformation protein and related proteins